MPGSQLRHSGCPEAKRAVDMHPCAACVRARDNLRERIAGTRADVAGLRAHDRRLVAAAEYDFERVRAHATLIVDRYQFNLLAAESEMAQGADGRDVHFVAGDHAHARSPLQAARLDIPSGTAQDFMPRGGETGEVRHVAAGHESDAGIERKPQELQHPAGDNVLDCGNRW